MAQDQKNNKPDASPTDNDQTEKMIQEALDQAQASVDQIREDAESASEDQPTSAPGLEAAAAVAADAEFAASSGAAGIEMLGDVNLHVTIELGRTMMVVEDVLKLSEGCVVELDKLAGDPVDVYVNQRLVARGEVLVLNDNFCIRISEIIADLDVEAEPVDATAQAE